MESFKQSDGFHLRRDRFERFLVRLRLIEAPFNWLQNVLGNLRALDACSIQMLSEIQRRLCYWSLKSAVDLISDFSQFFWDVFLSPYVYNHDDSWKRQKTSTEAGRFDH